MAGGVRAIQLAVAGFAALVAAAHHVLGDPLAEPLVEDEILTDVFFGQPLALALAGVLDDPAVHHADPLEAAVEVISARFFAADAAGTVHHDLPVFLIRQHFLHGGEDVAEVGHLRPDGSLEVAHRAFVVIAHVHDQGVFFIQELVYFPGAEVTAAFRYVEGLVIQAVGHDLRSHLDNQFQKGRGLGIDGDVETGSVQEGYGVQSLPERLYPRRGNGELAVDALGSHVDAAEHPQLRPPRVAVVAKGLRIRNVGVAVKGEGGAGLRLGVEAGLQFLAGEQIAQFVPFHSGRKDTDQGWRN